METIKAAIFLILIVTVFIVVSGFVIGVITAARVGDVPPANKPDEQGFVIYPVIDNQYW